MSRIILFVCGRGFKLLPSDRRRLGQHKNDEWVCMRQREREKVQMSERLLGCVTWLWHHTLYKNYQLSGQAMRHDKVLFISHASREPIPWRCLHNHLGLILTFNSLQYDQKEHTEVTFNIKKQYPLESHTLCFIFEMTWITNALNRAHLFL